MFSRRSFVALFFAAGALLAFAARAEEAPDAFIMRISTDVLDAVKADKSIQAGDVQKGHPCF